MENVYLIGFMGTGKSTVARELAKLLPLRVVEMDETIELLQGMKISDIFKNQGEEAFRNMESMLLEAISKEKNQIISCGGGVVLRESNIETMKKNGVAVLLTAEPDTVCERVNNNADRPLLEGKKEPEAVKKLMDSRKDAYEKAADMTFEVDGKTPSEIAGEIIRQLALEGYLH